MLIYRILNNNAVFSKDNKNNEVIVTGRGIAFRKQQYDEIDEKLITMIYTPQNAVEKNQIEELISEIPYDVISIAINIRNEAQEALKCDIDKGLIIQLADHINYSVTKFEKKIVTPNLMLNEIQQFYPVEFEVALHSLKSINSIFDVNLDENEAGFIAFHIVSSESGNQLVNVDSMIKTMNRIIETVEEYFNVHFDEDSNDYRRFIIHLKFFMQRVIRGKNENDKSLKEDSLYKMIVSKYSDINSCLDKIRAFLLLDYNYELSDSDRMYLIIHIARLVPQD